MTNMAMNAAAVYGMCCGIFLSFCMKDPFAAGQPVLTHPD